MSAALLPRRKWLRSARSGFVIVRPRHRSLHCRFPFPLPLPLPLLLPLPRRRRRRKEEEEEAGVRVSSNTRRKGCEAGTSRRGESSHKRRRSFLWLRSEADEPERAPAQARWRLVLKGGGGDLAAKEKGDGEKERESIERSYDLIHLSLSLSRPL